MHLIDFSSSELTFSDVANHAMNIWNCSVREVGEEERARGQKWFDQLQNRLDEHKISSDISVALVTGCETSNGHAFLHHGKPVAWISASNYPTELTWEVFGTHEVMHAIHYGRVPAYAFSSKSEKDHVGRQLVTEGVATYVTQQLLEISDAEALWADYLPQEELDDVMRKYREHVSESAKHLLHDWDRHDANYFYANDPTNVDAYRSGYYIGHLVVERIVAQQNINVNGLLSLDREHLDELVRDELMILANNLS